MPPFLSLGFLSDLCQVTLQFSSLSARLGLQKHSAPRQPCKNNCIDDCIMRKSNEGLDDYERILRV